MQIPIGKRKTRQRRSSRTDGCQSDHQTKAFTSLSYCIDNVGT